jgi:AcrR family transcriptional regulator
LRAFSREGILTATTADVAAEAAVFHGSVFAHFGSQEGLIAAQLEGIREREDFDARLVMETPMLPPSARNSLVLIQSTIAFHLSPAIAADREAGRIRAMPLALLFNTWIGLIHHYLVNREFFAPGASVIDSRGEELLDHFMSLISTGGYR